MHSKYAAPIERVTYRALTRDQLLELLGPFDAYATTVINHDTANLYPVPKPPAELKFPPKGHDGQTHAIVGVRLNAAFGYRYISVAMTQELYDALPDHEFDMRPQDIYE